jgi:hypothetical protein
MLLLVLILVLIAYFANMQQGLTSVKQNPLQKGE